MKKVAIIFFPFLLFQIFQFKFSFALDSTDIDKSFQDYALSISTFKKDYESFLLAKDRYLAFRSIASEVEAIRMSEKMMKSKVQLVKNYLTLVRLNLAAKTGILDYKENLAYLQLDNHLIEIDGLLTKISSSRTLLEIEKIDEELQKKFEYSQRLAYKSFGLVKIREFSNFIEALLAQHKLLKEKIEAIKSEGDFDVSLIEQRILDLEKNIDSQQTKLTQSSKTFSVAIDSDPKEAYLAFENSLKEIKLNLSRAISSLEEIIILLKSI